MTVQSAMRWIAIGSALCIVVAVPLESLSMEAMMAGMAVSLVAPLGIAVSAVLSARNFSRQASRAVMADAFLIAALPVVAFILLAMFHAEPNVHGGVILGIILWVPLSEVTALIMMISVGVRTVRIRNRPEGY